MIIKNNNNILYEADNIFVPKRDCPIEINKKETYIVKYYLNKEIILKKINFMIFKKIYLIIILKKLIGNQPNDCSPYENGVIISFSECPIEKNSTKVNEGLIPGIYYTFK